MTSPSLAEQIENALSTRTPQPTFDRCGFAYGNVCPRYVPAAMELPNQSASVGPGKVASPGFFRATFTLGATGDTFLDVRNLGKGVVWINGHSLGRFWNVGPQATLYVSGPWLKQGANEIVVFDLKPVSDVPQVLGLDHPILNAPVADQSGNRKQD